MAFVVSLQSVMGVNMVRWWLRLFSIYMAMVRPEWCTGTYEEFEMLG